MSSRRPAGTPIAETGTQNDFVFMVPTLGVLEPLGYGGMPRPLRGSPPDSRTVDGDGQGLGLAPRGAPQDSRRLGLVLPRLRLCAALLRRVGGRAAEGVPAVRRRDAFALPRVRRALQLGLRRRVRGLRHGTARG